MSVFGNFHVNKISMLNPARRTTLGSDRIGCLALYLKGDDIALMMHAIQDYGQYDRFRTKLSVDIVRDDDAPFDYLKQVIDRIEMHSIKFEWIDVEFENTQCVSLYNILSFTNEPNIDAKDPDIVVRQETGVLEIFSSELLRVVEGREI